MPPNSGIAGPVASGSMSGRDPVTDPSAASVIYDLTSSMIASFLMNTYPPRPTTPSATTPEKIAIPLIIFCMIT